MGFLKNIFGSKNETVKKEKCIPEYHKCPMCGEMVKTNHKLYSNNPERYLDGEPKVTASEIANSLQLCEKCGYIYEGYDYEFWSNTTPPIDAIHMKNFNTDVYQKIFKNTEMDSLYKKLLLFDLLNETNIDDSTCSAYHEYKYVCEINNFDKEMELLLSKLNDVVSGKISGFPIDAYKLCYENKNSVSIGSSGLEIDFMRRLGNFEQAKKYITFEMKKLQKDGKQDTPKYEYLTYQLQLVEAQDKRHI